MYRKYEITWKFDKFDWTKIILCKLIFIKKYKRNNDEVNETLNRNQQQSDDADNTNIDFERILSEEFDN